MEVGLFCHPNDIAASLDYADLRRRGLGRLAVNILYHDWTAWAPLSASAPLRRERGGASAVPVRAHYPDGLAPRTGDTTTLGIVVERAREAGLNVDAWTVGLHRDDLATRSGPHEEWTVVDAFGTRQPAWLCPSSPASQAYLEAHARDIADGHGFARLILEGGHYPLLQHGSAHERDLSRLPLALTERLETCFCRGCCERYEVAGISAENLRKAVQDEVRSGATPAVSVEALARSADLRRERVIELLAALRAAAPGLEIVFPDQPAIGGQTFRTGTVGQRPIPSIHAAAGIDPGAIAVACADFLALAYFRASADFARHIESYLAVGVPAEKLAVALRAAPPDSEDIAKLREKLRLARNLGVVEVHFYELTQLDADSWAQTMVAVEVAAAL